MCEACVQNGGINLEEVITAFKENVLALIELHAKTNSLQEKDKSFANSLYDQFIASNNLSSKQWNWVHMLLEKIVGQKPLEGSFAAIQIMFRMATTTGGLKKPKIRLMSKENTYVQLDFDVENPGKIKVFRDGWAGHGTKKFCGIIEETRIIPDHKLNMTDDVVEVIQQLAQDPQGTAIAMAKLLGVCLYCGRRLSDEESKARGYGKTCATHWGMPWGKGK